MAPPPRPIPFTVALLALAALIGCGEKDEPDPAPPPAGVAEERETSDAAPRDDEEARDDAERGDPPSEGGAAPAERTARLRRDAERVVRAYLEALDAGDGGGVCRTMTPGALDGVRMPRDRGSCAASLDASIGYRDPRGLPQFAGLELTGFRATDASPRTARVTAAIVTRFADRDEPSVEDDIVYLRRGGGGYEVAKASASLYRAVGIADIPFDVISPPE